MSAPKHPHPTPSAKSGQIHGGGTDAPTHADALAAMAGGPSSSVLYTLLQDLGLIATAQSLCDELQRRGVCPAPASTEEVPTATTTVTAAPRATQAPKQAVSASVSVPPVAEPHAQHTSAATRRRRQSAPAASAEETPTASLTHPATPDGDATATAARASTAASTAADGNGNDRTHHRHDLLRGDPACSAALTALATCAVEPLCGNSPRAEGEALEQALHTLWAAEARTVASVQEAPIGDPASTANAVAVRHSSEYRVATLVARAAWCELRITELIFIQDYSLTHAASAPATASGPSMAGSDVRHISQKALVESAMALVATLQELRTVTGSVAHLASAKQDTGEGDCADALSPLLVGHHLHVKAAGWLRNAECVMTWLLRRQTSLAEPATQCSGAHSPMQQQQQQRKRRCLESESADDTQSCAGPDAVPLRLRSLQDALLRIPTCLAADEQATVDGRSTAAAAAKANATLPTMSSLSHAVQLPRTVRAAMAVQRVKLVLALMAAATCSGARSLLWKMAQATVAEAEASGAAQARAWWAWRCMTQAQFLTQASRLLQSAQPKSTAASSAFRRLADPVGALVGVLDQQAARLVLSPAFTIPTTSDGRVEAGTPQHLQRFRETLRVCVRILHALEGEQAQAAAALDRLVLGFATASTAVKGLPSGVTTHPPSAEAAASAPSGASGSPLVVKDASAVGSPVWTLPLPTLPPPTAVGMGAGGPAALPLAPLSPSLATTHQQQQQHHGVDGDAAAADTHRTAARVLRWSHHFHDLLSTLATGSWQAPATPSTARQRCSRYHRTRLNLMEAVTHAQELLRLQPRRPIAANGSEYVPHPTADVSSGAPLSLAETMPRALQLLTLQHARTLQRIGERLSPQARDGGSQKGREESTGGGVAAAHRGVAGRGRGQRRAPRTAAPSVPPPSSASTSVPERQADRGDATAVMARIAAGLQRRLLPSTQRVWSPPSSLPQRAASTDSATPDLDVDERSVHSFVSAPPSDAMAAAAAAAAATVPLQLPDAASSSSGTETVESPEPLDVATSDSSPSSSSPTSAYSPPSSPYDEEATQSDDSGGSVEVEEDEEGPEDAAALSEDETAISVYGVADEEAGLADEQHEGNHSDEAAEEGSDYDWLRNSQEEEEDEGEEEDGDETMEEEEEEEGEGEEEEDVASDASSADLDYERAEDAMKEEVECVEVTPDGRLLALLTARGRLTVLRLLARDSAQHYQEEVVLDATLPRVPSARLQWYEALSSFVRFSPCHRFVIASVQFLSICERQNARGALARFQKDNSGEVCVYSLHCRPEQPESAAAGCGTEKGGPRRAAEQRQHSNNGGSSRSESHRAGSAGRAAAAAAAAARTSAPPSSFSDRLQDALNPLPDALYESFRPHTAPCLSARWIDPRWWGGGRRSGWANKTTEPLNTATAAAAALVRDAMLYDGDAHASSPLPTAWRAAAAVLLSEYQCLSVGLDDRIVRWMPASGVVLQCISTEPVQDLIVSPLMAAFYVMTDAGQLCMYDAWDERDSGEPGSRSLWANSRDVCEYESRPLRLAVTDTGHPCCYRTGAGTQPYTIPDSGDAEDDGYMNANEEEEEESNVWGLHGAGGGFDEHVHRSRHSVHFTGPVTPVFQRMIDPLETRRRRARASRQRHMFGSSCCSLGDGTVPREARNVRKFEEALEQALEAEAAAVHNGAGVRGRRGLPANLQWVLPRHWTAHSPWDAQLGRRLIAHMLRRSGEPSSAQEGQLCYEREGSGAAVVAGSGARQGDDGSWGGPRADERDDLSQCSETSTLAGSSADDEGRAEGEEDDWEYDYTNPPNADERGSAGGARPSPCLDAGTASAAARDTPLAVRELAAHPTPARGCLRRAYYPAGACLRYESVARALCVAGDLADRQRNDEMGPGGFTHHLLSFALSGQPQWTAQQQRLGSDDDDEEHDEDSEHEDGGGERKQISSSGGGREAAHKAAEAPSLHTRWPATALARLVLWKNRLGSLRGFRQLSPQLWSQWESDVLTTSFHADVRRGAAARRSSDDADEEGHADSSLSSVTASATELLQRRGYGRARDVWRRGAPAAQRGLSATARNGRYLCITASIGPYRKLVNPREPLRDVKGIYACLVFDVYAGAVLRVIPVCPVYAAGLRGVNMTTSEQHEADPKVPLYRLQCAVTVVPVVESTRTHAPPSSSSSSSPAGGDTRYTSRAAEHDESDAEEAEPREIVTVTVGGLANTVYLFDAMNGRRLASTSAVERQCSLSAAAAYNTMQQQQQSVDTQQPSLFSSAEESNTKKPSRATSADRVPLSAPPPHTAAASAVDPLKASLFSSPSTLLPPSIRTPSDVVASITTWGRGTGFDGITDHSSSSSSSSGSSDTSAPLRVRRGGAHHSVGSPVAVFGSPPPPDASPRHEHSAAAAKDASASAAHHTNEVHKNSDGARSDVNDVMAQVLGEETHLPRMLQPTVATAAVDAPAEWGLRGVLRRFHDPKQRTDRTQVPPSSLAHLAEEDQNSESDWEKDADIADGHSSSSSKTTNAPPPQSAARNGHGSAAAASHASLLRSFCSSLLGFKAPTRLLPASPTATEAPPAHERLQSGAGGQLVPSRAAEWTLQRQRLLERALRHYSVDLLWQAYLALFSSAATATDGGGLAPQSAVAALVQWAHATLHPQGRPAPTSAAAAAAAAELSTAGPAWVWCAARRRSSAALIVTPASTAAARHTTAAPHSAATAQEPDSAVPFARVLQHRECFAHALRRLEDGAGEGEPTPSRRRGSRGQSASPHATLAAQLVAQAAADGTLPRRSPARSSAGRSALRLPPTHHQNQMHVDVVNAVATWRDANGGFYMCIGSEDGGVYLLGGNVSA